MLTHPCPECTEGRVYRFGGNNPDGWSRRCDDCDGTSKIPIRCEGYPCRALAVRIVDGAPLCDACATEAEQDLLEEDEFREAQLREMTT